MKTFTLNGGLSARQITTYLFGKLRFLLKGSLTIALTACALLTGCDKNTNGQVVQKKSSEVSKDTLNKPVVNIKVNRRFDDKGNVIAFDSTYSSYYSNIKSDTGKMDSVMNRFGNFFRSQHPLFFQNSFQPLFFNDSINYPDFFHTDYFLKRYEMNDPFMRRMMKEMDSIKNDYYKQDHVLNKNAKQPRLSQNEKPK
jgi:hypothetical protein